MAGKCGEQVLLDVAVAGLSCRGSSLAPCVGLPPGNSQIAICPSLQIAPWVEQAVLVSGFGID